ncbi:hypothetical protein [uncultured Mucilaginibacter sp.]|uniref:hypothetical protein n=1 Tax=uncultured Mucilaginibacter sp. TaxID=797541 RepID=UPI0025D2ADAF|nr:hypothetical protein [uncultured Mucilaginibacter sp.]
MKPRFLFPSIFRYLGYLLALPGFVLGYFVLYKDYAIPGFELKLRAKNEVFLPAIENFTNELAITLVIIGLLFIAFSKVKREDELTARIRLSSLYWAILANYAIYFVLFIVVRVCWALNITFLGPDSYDNDFIQYNLFTPLLIFIVIFYYRLYRSKNEYNSQPNRYLPNKPYRFLGVFGAVAMVLLLIAGAVFNTPSFDFCFQFLPFPLLLWAYSKEKTDDEYIDSIRLEAMQMAVYVNYCILLISNFLVYGLDFLGVESFNMLTIPVIYIAWFHYKMYRINHQTEVKAAQS